MTPTAELLAATQAETDAANSGLRREPELPDHVAAVKEIAKPALPPEEFAVIEDTPEEQVRRAQAIRRGMRDLARQASLDHDDGLGL